MEKYNSKNKSPSTNIPPEPSTDAAYNSTHTPNDAAYHTPPRQAEPSTHACIDAAHHTTPREAEPSGHAAHNTAPTEEAEPSQAAEPSQEVLFTILFTIL